MDTRQDRSHGWPAGHTPKPPHRAAAARIKILMELLTVEPMLLLFAVGFAAGLLDAIAGGGGLIALPALLSTGMSPVEALGTNKLQGSFGTTAAARHFFRHGHIDMDGAGLVTASTFVGALAGSLAVQYTEPGFLSALIPVLLVANALYFLFSPRVGDVERHRRLGLTGFAFLVGGGLGFYDGFFGPGTGSFFALAYVVMLGYSLTRATAHTKLLNMTSNLAALLLFALNGHVVWPIGLLMGVAQVLGATVGAHLVIRRGAVLVRPLIVIVCLVMTARLLATQPDHSLLQWLGL
jgi:hypothetical protein